MLIWAVAALTKHFRNYGSAALITHNKKSKGLVSPAETEAAVIFPGCVDVVPS